MVTTNQVAWDSRYWMGPAGHGKEEKSRQTHLLVKSVRLVGGVTRLVMGRKISIITKIFSLKSTEMWED